MEGDVRKKSPKVAFLELYDALERKLKRHAPRDYITWTSKGEVDGRGGLRMRFRVKHGMTPAYGMQG